MVNNGLPETVPDRRVRLVPRSDEADDVFFEVLSLGYPVSDAAERAR
jgi:hypothetical protein